MGTNSAADAATGQVSQAAAEVYEEFFVPALFAQWTAPMLDAVGAGRGDTLVDVGTGTGVLARAALARVGPTGTVVGVDPNDGMLAVAARLAPELDMRRGVAERLPVADNEMSCATCQFALMFVEDRDRAVTEMARVTMPGGRIAIATWAAVDESPGYAAMVDLLGDVVGDGAAEALRAPFCIGTADELEDLLTASFGDAVVHRRAGRARFASLDAWLHTDIRGWTLSDAIDDGQYERLRRAAATELREFVDDDGSVTFAAPALIATATVD
ncbi:methyltransferase domain-containing protein [Mycolicibacterium moriokaense]|nr:methyltransferase domain-containing protein [Mycolicibacterium moriokaense]